MTTSIANIAPEFDYDAGTDGVISIGPVRIESLDHLSETMERHGVFAFTPSCDVTAMRDGSGRIHITAVSEVITGYLVDDEGQEAASSDIEDFLRDILEDGQSLTMSGSYPDGADGHIATRARFMRRGDTILSDIHRMALGADGGITPVMDQDDVSAYERSLAAAERPANVVNLADARAARGAA